MKKVFGKFIFIILSLIISQQKNFAMDESLTDNQPYGSHNKSLISPKYNQNLPKEVLAFPKVGPIKRYLTSTSITLMGQGDIPNDGLFHHDHTINTGIVYLRTVNNPLKEGNTYLGTFPMDITDRHVGHVTLNKLHPGKRYILLMGYVQGPIANNELSIDNFKWANAHEVPFTTLNKNPTTTFSCIFSCCRRIGLKTNDWKEAGDKTFEAMYHNIKESNALLQKTDFIGWIGDQIYADGPFNPLHHAKTFEEYARLYEIAFSQPHIRNLISSFNGPIHMLRDDHESWNDANAEEELKYPEQSAAAHSTYTLYQRPFGKETPNFWFETSNGVDVFYTDTRSERFPSQNIIMSATQTKALTNWLSADVRKDRIKIIATSVPFFMLNSDDSWAGFPEQRLALLSYIMENNIQKVMFISGDAHCYNDVMYDIYESNGTETKRKILEVLVSGIFAVAHTKAALLTGKVDVTVDSKGYILKSDKDIAHTTIKDNLFARLSGNHETGEVHIQVYNAANKLLNDVKHIL